MSELNPQERNPHAPFRDHWDKQRHQNENPPVFETLNEWHDHLSALTWNEEKKEGNK